MLKRYQTMIGGVFRLVDATVIVLAWLISYPLRFYVPLIEVTKGFPRFQQYAALSPLVLVLWMVVFSSMDVYRSQRMLRRTQEAWLLIRAHSVALVCFITLTYLFSEYKYSRGVLIYFAVLGALFLVVFRLLLRNSLREARRRGFNLRHAVVVGEGSSLSELVARLDRFPEIGVRVMGAVTETGQGQGPRGKPVLGRFDQFQQVLAEHHPDIVIFALPRRQAHHLDALLEAIRDETIDVQVVPDVSEYVTLGCEVEDFDGIPMVRINDSPLQGWGAVLKRMTDFVLASIGLVLISPVLLVIAIAIKLTSRGPILYRQERMGLDGRTFGMLKFRSMKIDAEKETGAVWAKPGDDRRTPIGALLRSTSLDELPQLWNVIRGEMSLVGPRPERPVFVQQFKGNIPHYMLRHKVKAGITGWAQVNGWRGDTSLEKRIECDLYYIRHWSYLLDLKILLMTFWKGFVNRNAY